MSTSTTRSIQNDFGGNFSAEVFHDEIRNSSFNSKYQFFNVSGDTVEIFFSSPLTSSEETELDTIVANHDPTTLVVYMETHTIFVSQRGNDSNSGRFSSRPLKTLTKAIEIVTALGVPTKIHFTPGTHSVQNTNPISLPDRTVLAGSEGITTTTFLPTNASGHLFEPTGTTYIQNIRMKDLTNSTAVYIENNSKMCFLSHVWFETCQTSIHTINSPEGVRIESSDITGTNQYGIRVDQSKIHVQDLHIADSTVRGIEIIDDASIVDIQQISFSSCTTGFYARGVAIASSCLIRGCTTGISCDGTKLDVTVSPLNIVSGTTDVEISSGAQGHVHFPVGFFSRSKIVDNSTPGDVHIMSLFSDKVERGPATLLGDFSVGTYLYPSRSVFGEGHPAFQGMVVLTQDEMGTFEDVTTLVTHNDSSTVKFSSLLLGSRLYIGADFPFTGLKTVTDVAIDLGALGELSWQYGVNEDPESSSTALNTWTQIGRIANNGFQIPFSIQARQSTPPYTCFNTPSNGLLSRNADLFGRVGSEHVRFGYMSYWVPTTVQTITKYWFRITIEETIDLSPEINQILLTTNNFTLDQKGFSETFGKAQGLVKMPGLHLQNMVRNTTFGTPSSASVSFSSDITLLLENSVFSSGVERGISTAMRVPEDMDTSIPLELVVDFVLVSTTLSDTLDLRVAHGFSNLGATIDGSQISFLVHSVDATSTTVSGVNTLLEYTEGINSQQRARFLIHMPKLAVTPDLNAGVTSPDLVWFSVLRDGTADSYTGDIHIVSVEASYHQATVSNHQDSRDSLFVL